MGFSTNSGNPDLTGAKHWKWGNDLIHNCLRNHSIPPLVTFSTRKLYHPISKGYLGWEHVTPVTKWWAGNPLFFVKSLSPWMIEGAIGFVSRTFEWTCMNTLKQKLCFKWLQTYICWMFLHLFVIMLFAFVWCVALLAGFRTCVCMFCIFCMFLHVVLACCCCCCCCCCLLLHFFGCLCISWMCCFVLAVLLGCSLSEGEAIWDAASRTWYAWQNQVASTGVRKCVSGLFLVQTTHNDV